MLKPQVQGRPHVSTPLLVRPAISVNESFFPYRRVPSAALTGRRKQETSRIVAVTRESLAVKTTDATKKTVSIKAVVTVNVLSKLGISCLLDDIIDLCGKTIHLELVSAELDPKTGLEKPTIKGYAYKGEKGDGERKYEGDFAVSSDFGEIGAVLVTNEHHTDMHFKNIVLKGFGDSPVNITCNSWVHGRTVNPAKRVFFVDKSYLPSQTPGGLSRLRKEELEILRGNGQGERKKFERIYDYDTYNDLGDPDTNNGDLARPVLGGKAHPYPRRCRTGRPHTSKDPFSESRTKNLESIYVPRDEEFSEVKQVTFSVNTLRSVLHSVVPSIDSLLHDPSLGFPFFTSIDELFNTGDALEKPKGKGIMHSNILLRLVNFLKEGREEILLFETPEILERDKFSWFRDEEFARQTLAGLNPLSIQLVTEFPLESKLDPKIYGPKESLITKGLVQREIKGVMTVEQALEHKKLFMLDYHDLYLPYVHKVREIEGTTLYGSRMLFFLTEDCTLVPIAIELTRPASPTKPQWKQVFTPGTDATSCWLWRVAKSHVAAHDAGYHQLVIHWLRTHCCSEPYIIAANRQLSAIHPMYRLLHPHFRYTMEINALARQSLINAGGIIESSFSPGKYSMELSSVAYDKLWRFDHQALPVDLISRGMAVEDPTAENGLKLVIEDYPFANDGLLIWSALKQWVTDYVDHYYPDSDAVSSDSELQSWWAEVKTKGHGDKKDEPWWPSLQTPADLTHIITTMVWVVSCHHAAVNFGQYPYGGYFPNRPTIVRKEMPVEDCSREELKRFLRKPENALLNTFPTQIQATKVMAVLNVLSTHSPDEEYLGEQPEPAWASNPVIKAAFERFSGRMKEIEGIIDERNCNLELKNRTGAGVVPYELLKPGSTPGVTGKGVPNSISI